jgi:hypothetical protein
LADILQQRKELIVGNTKLFKTVLYSVLIFIVDFATLSCSAQSTPNEHRNPLVGSYFNKDGFLQIVGTARLIIGLYELPGDDERLQEIADSGFNLVWSPQDTKALDRIDKHGLYAWISLDSTAQLRRTDHDSEQKLAEIINKFKNQSSLLVWELPDEALWNIWWSRFNWVFGGQQRELCKYIEGAGNTRTNFDTAKFISLLEKANDYNDRGLWDQAEEIYDAMWNQLQAKNPHPTWKMSQCPNQVNELTDAIAQGCRVIKHLDFSKNVLSFSVSLMLYHHDSIPAMLRNGTVAI